MITAYPALISVQNVISIAVPLAWKMQDQILNTVTVISTTSNQEISVFTVQTSVWHVDQQAVGLAKSTPLSLTKEPVNAIKATMKAAVLVYLVQTLYVQPALQVDALNASLTLAQTLMNVHARQGTTIEEEFV
jgi:hypothetical protein